MRIGTFSRTVGLPNERAARLDPRRSALLDLGYFAAPPVAAEGDTAGAGQPAIAKDDAATRAATATKMNLFIE
ncbi:MAG: hypothetical protein FJZ00_05585 [Candidatus Sericytochromatia bacterium]|uniref:Uncharacterized protein n=1 Tax=Candidatus Tanganyikabacteria bacterium TaxID=2961651 RepID=A0A937X596_9BACT|nr:hypothetical protein [Candidatus Tanganyikabacteria bacterium]